MDSWPNRGARAAEQAYAWTRAVGGLANDEVKSVAVDSSGNVYVAGYFNQTVDFDPGTGADTRTSTGDDIFFCKYDSAGNYIFTKTIGGTGNDSSFSIAVSSSGFLYIAGAFSNTVDFDPGAGVDNRTSAGGYDIFLSKYDLSGNHLWTKTIGGAGDDIARSLAIDTSANVFIAGSFNLTVDFDPGAATDNRTSAGYSDIFVSKYNSSGNYGWTKAVGGSNSSGDVANSVAVDSSGSVFLAGYFSGTVDFDPGASTDNRTSAGGIDIFLSKYDSSGNYVWTKAVGGSSSDSASSIAIDSNDSLYMVGGFILNVDFNPGAGVDNKAGRSGLSDIFISKYDVAGNYLWTNHLVGGPSYNNYANSVAVDISGNIYVAGYLCGITDFDPGSGTDIRASYSGTAGMYLSKYSSNGAYFWTKLVDG